MPLASAFLHRVLSMPLEIRTHLRDFTWSHWRRGYHQQSHRSRGETIHIRGTSGVQVREMKQQLRMLAQRINMPLIQIAQAIYTEQLAEFDLQPLDPDCPEFIFEERVEGEVSDNVPTPDDNADAARAIAAFQRDAEICDSILGQGGASVEQLLAVSRNGRRWSEFWAFRHPNPVVRDRLTQTLAEHAALRAENVRKAQRQLERKRANGTEH